MTKELAVIDFDTLQRQATALYASNFFNDVKSQAQAIVKVMAGAELGVPPFASMTNIDIIQGKPALSANMMASLVDRDPRYDFEVIECDSKKCVLKWHRDGREVGQSSFTIEEAQQAQLAGKDNWRKYPSDMLFARAISRGTRRFAPGVFAGVKVYTPDELGDDVDPGYVEGEVITEQLDDTPNGMPTDDTPFTRVTAPEPQPEEPKYTDAQAEQAQEVIKPNGNGARFAGNVADARAWLEEKAKDGHIIAGLVADAASMTGLYSGREHVRNALKGNDEKPGYDWTAHGASADFVVNFGHKWTLKAALKIFDWLMARKAKE